MKTPKTTEQNLAEIKKIALLAFVLALAVGVGLIATIVIFDKILTKYL